MSRPQPLEDLPVDEIRAAITVDIAEMSDDQIMAIEQFVERIGGVENALAALDMLEELERAA